MDSGKLKALELIKKAAMGSLIKPKEDGEITVMEVKGELKDNDSKGYKCPFCGKDITEYCEGIKKERYKKDDTGSDDGGVYDGESEEHIKKY